MKMFQLTGTHPRFLLMNQLQSREEKWYRASTVFILTSRRTEIATSAWGPREQNKGSLQKTHWHSRTSGTKSLVSWWQQITKSFVMWISKQSSIRCSGTNFFASQWIRSCPCKTITFQETEKSLQKFLEPMKKPKVIYTKQFLRIWQSLWRCILESLYVHTSPFRNKWYCWENVTQD